MLYTAVIEPGTLGILKYISSHDIFESFCLVGGTALALQMGHRLSIDLDFFSPQPFDKELVKTELSEYGDWLTFSENKIGLRGQLNNVKVDFVTYRYPLLEPATSEGGIRMFSTKDIAAMKLSAITNRGAKKDFYDIYFLMRQYGLSQLLEWYQQKYQTNNLFMVLKSLTYFDDAELTETPVLLQKKTGWITVKKTILAAVTNYV
ncbi:nucleotidyl transferase AbiEii/AbiGii toxin family protein [Larkinella knui]|uniref:Nucleotidyl transferase AbiEii/AbiGii toxin family protein n=1 Tax=Larkinella knui TaxID=2025310 RepID=A0A3P1CCN8_9BACT|nr:nucleotidyl transferase AbiEii/AbiGii toxin family protein [Larkinella knui]RRB11067.1 hypothetical protein EHT87_28425 [Larkinella knui]